MALKVPPKVLSKVLPRVLPRVLSKVPRPYLQPRNPSDRAVDGAGYCLRFFR